jgi:hypothetical protein
VRVDIQARERLNGKLRNHVKMGVETVRWWYFVNTVMNIAHSIKSVVFHNRIKLSPSLSATPAPGATEHKVSRSTGVE